MNPESEPRCIVVDLSPADIERYHNTARCFFSHAERLPLVMARAEPPLTEAELLARLHDPTVRKILDDFHESMKHLPEPESYEHRQARIGSYQHKAKGRLARKAERAQERAKLNGDKRRKWARKHGWVVADENGPVTPRRPE